MSGPTFLQPSFLQPGFRQPGFIQPAFSNGISASNPMAGVTQDATSLIYCPASAVEWTIALAAAGIATGNPSALYLHTELAGNLADSIGTFVLANAATAPLYNQPVAGWSRKGITTANAATTAFINTDAGLPDLTASNMLFLSYTMFSSAGGARLLHRLGTGAATTEDTRLQSTNVATAVSGAASANGAGNPVGFVRPYVTKFNRTGLTGVSYTDQDKMVPVFAASVVGKGLQYMGDATMRSPAATNVYAAAFFGAAAALSDAQVKTLLQTLGWIIAWS